MRSPNRISAFLGGLAATLLMTSSLANNGIQFQEFDIVEGPPGAYVPCLGEHVVANWHVRAVFHEFITPAGTFHVIDSWMFTTMVTGLVTDRTWFGRNTSPLQVNVGPGESIQWVFQGMLRPVTGDGPMWKYHTTFKITITPNGDLVVLHEPAPTFGESTTCIGKPS